jgi:hypothetical protein
MQEMGNIPRQQEYTLEVVQELQKHMKRKGTPPSQIIRYFGNKIPYLKNDLIKLALLNDLALYIAKGH